MQIIIDSCILISILSGEKRGQMVIDKLLELSRGNNLVINQINLFEVRYILKNKSKREFFNIIDSKIDNFLAQFNITSITNENCDYIEASNYKGEGGLSPYDTFILVVANKNLANSTIITMDKEFDNKKYTDKFNFIFI
jgi:predicted nucleic acid-binding protein